MPNYRIINTTFFTQGDNLIAGIEKNTIGGQVIQFIDQYSDDFLQKALGYSFYKTVMAALQAQPGDGMYYDIVHGAEYTHNGRLKLWKGLRQDEVLKSIVADYVYFHYMKIKATQSTVSGESKANKENAERATPGYKMNTQWNYMIEQVHILWEFLKYKTDVDGDSVYPTFNMRDVDCETLDFVNMFGL